MPPAPSRSLRPRGRAASRTTNQGEGPAVSPRCYDAERLRGLAAGDYERFVGGPGRAVRPRVARSLALAGIRPGLTVVDLGCGRGEAACRAAMRGAWVFGLDYSLEAAALSRDTVREVSASRRACIMAASVAAVPLADRAADRVLMLDVVEHLRPRQLRAALAEARRILRPDGYVVIHTLPNRWAMGLGYRALRLLVPGLPRDPRSEYEKAVHVNEQSPASLSRALARSGLERRVWVEEWTTRHAERAPCGAFPDAARAAGYPLLGRRAARRLGRTLMGTPLRWWVANDIFALAWLPGGPAPPRGGRYRFVR